MKKTTTAEEIKKSLSEDGLVNLIATINKYNSIEEIANILEKNIKWLNNISSKEEYNPNKTGISIDNNNIIIFYEDYTIIDGDRVESESTEILSGECQDLFKDLLKKSKTSIEDIIIRDKAINITRKKTIAEI